MMGMPDAEHLALTQEKLQELADGLIWQHAEGNESSEDTYRRNVSLTVGWNNAMRIVAQEIGVEVTLKPYGERVRHIPAPPGHDSFTWEGGKMGKYTCQCGKTRRCREDRAESVHQEHRTVLAWKVIASHRSAQP